MRVAYLITGFMTTGLNKIAAAIAMIGVNGARNWNWFSL